MTDVQEHIELRISKLIDALKENYRKGNTLTSIDFEVVPGKRYYKLVLVDTGRSVHAFIDKTTGYVYKPASWNAPAKHVRYRLLDDNSFSKCLSRADWAGGYLYM